MRWHWGEWFGKVNLSSLHNGFALGLIRYPDTRDRSAHCVGPLTWQAQPTRDWGDAFSMWILGREGAGFAWLDDGGITYVLVPPWCPLLAFGGLPVSRAIHAYRRRPGRVPEGHCPACGYDLQATPARCPESGTPTLAA